MVCVNLVYEWLQHELNVKWPIFETETTVMLILDPQVDFHRGGSCAIKDADISSESVSNFISYNKDGIEEIYIGLDSHHRWVSECTYSQFSRYSHDDIYIVCMILQDAYLTCSVLGKCFWRKSTASHSGSAQYLSAFIHISPRPPCTHTSLIAHLTL